MYAGVASGAVTIGLALVLIMMSQKPDASGEPNHQQPEPPAVETTATAKPPPQAAVVLPPPPAPAIVNASSTPAPEAATPAPPAVRHPTLKPRKAETPRETVEVTPLQPRPEPPPLEAAPPEAAPSRDPEPTPAPEEIPPEQIADLPATGTKAAIPARPHPVTVTRQTVKEGRALLKMLEIGKGPVIEIAWPQKRSARSRLYDLLTVCHGMQTAMLTQNSRLFALDTRPGATWRINRDAVSGFLRQPAGVLTDAEQSVIERIKTRHGIASASPVRVFPRGVDATLLGGLGGIVGPGYLKYGKIQARYRLTGNRIAVIDIRADGRTLPGEISLPRTRRCG